MLLNTHNLYYQVGRIGMVRKYAREGITHAVILLRLGGGVEGGVVGGGGGGGCKYVLSILSLRYINFTS